ncbi:ParM/StbA family protein [Cytobacillus horneckiae]|uniref:Uncharacterized protein n=1 Tax=Cytobacillus horneckiae TaxID=549687 RepID=A0A2N0ZAZ9_9BACI|nr:ParM/StbA family protein [Cytobacillus horneckiae]MEC1158707.1 ParM/StbA family protein [Cytobacillus horneckiae]NRG46665.1 ParM/StbA family protein [Bacillus sp. CRN 9]PKG26683.1 hypothetical protein CWS20_22815 [Cytobacillus horneckiae]
MSYQEIVSIDIGYGYVKAISSSGKRALFPSVVGSGRERNLANFMKTNDLKTDLSEMHIKINDKHHYIGEMALRNSIDGSRVFERERYNHDYTTILLHAAIQTVISDDTHEVLLFTGLPLDYYKSQVKQFKQKILTESPVIEWVSGLSNGTKQVKITDTSIFPQGMAAIWAALINHEGRFLNNELLKEGTLIAVIDIGFRTTDICVVEMKGHGGFIPLLPYSDTIDQGVINLHENIKRSYQDKTGGADISETTINKIIKNLSINYKGKKIDMTNEVNEAHQSVANSINDRINTLWKNESDTFDQIFTVGGGGKALTGYMQDNFDNRLETIVDGQFANAIGNYRIGKMLMGDSIKEQIAN